jgi:hypothetical protein
MTGDKSWNRRRPRAKTAPEGAEIRVQEAVIPIQVEGAAVILIPAAEAEIPIRVVAGVKVE